MLKSLLFVFGVLLCTKMSFAGNHVEIKDLRKNLSDPKKALSDLYSTPEKWAYVMKQIEIGKSDWVKLWPDFRKVSDAGASEELDLVMSHLVGNNSNLALRTINEAWHEEEARVITEQACRVTGNEVQESEGLMPEEEKNCS